MAFANVAGRAGFVIDLDKSALDKGLPQAEREFQSSYTKMARSTDGLTKSSQSYTQQVIAESRANLANLRDMKARNLVSEATRKASQDLTGSYTRLADRQTVVARTAGQAERAIGGRGVGLSGSLGLIGVAAAVGIQALNEASSSLRVTGANAGTTEGHIRNLGSELLQGNVIGGLKQLSTQAYLTDAALSNLQAEVDRADFSNFNRQLDNANRGVSRLDIFKQSGFDPLGPFKVILGTGTENKKLLAQLQAAQLQAALDFQNAPFRNTTTGAVRSTPVGGRPDDRGGLQGPGGAAAIDFSNLSPTGSSASLSLPVGLQRSRQDAQLTRAVQDDLVQARKEASHYKSLAANKKLTNAEKMQARDLYVQAVQEEQRIEDQIASVAQRATDERARTREKAARDQAAERERTRRAVEIAGRVSGRFGSGTEKWSTVNAGEQSGFKQPASGTGDPFGEMAQAFLRSLSGQARAYASNAGPLHQTLIFNSNTPPFQAARDARRAAEAVYG